MSNLKILAVTSEAAPFARTGGLGDVLGALPKSLAKAGHDVKVFMPRYEVIDGQRHQLKPSGQTFSIPGLHGSERADIFQATMGAVDYYFVSNARYFDRIGLYQDHLSGKDYFDNDERFIFFSRAVLESVRAMRWTPDIIHLNDWQTAIIPSLLTHQYQTDGFFSASKTVLTIHNLGYQGIFDAAKYSALKLPKELFYAVTGAFEFFGKVNFLKAGIMTADHLTTVSPQYAKEVVSSEEFGFGLEGVLQQRKHDLTGILNGVNYHDWSPARDTHINFTYSPANLTRKRMNKTELLKSMGLPQRENVPLVGMISRLAAQKGFDLLGDSAEELFSRDLQLVVLGVGDKEYHHLLHALQQKYPDKMRAILAFDNSLAHKIEASADMLLMPSRYEPCGLNQMYSLKYGTAPIVRKVGGLSDSVEEFVPTTKSGTGFLFTEYTPLALLEAVDKALDVFKQKRVWNCLMKNGMAKDFSWDVSAENYLKVFQKILTEKQPAHYSYD